MFFKKETDKPGEKFVVSGFANEPGILHVVLIFVFLTVLKNCKSVSEICFHTLKAFAFTGCCVVVHLSSVSFTAELDDLRALFQPA